MFNGIVQSLGSIQNFNKKLNAFSIKTKLDLTDCKAGSSICCDGVCLTVTEINKLNDDFIFTVCVGEETLRRSNLIYWKKYRTINLEKSLKFGDEISGHFVYGHVDTVLKVISILKQNFSWLFTFSISGSNQKENKKFILEKSSIAINGISLTVATVHNQSFDVSIIPHTYKNTNLFNLLEGDLVNIEYDYLARYVGLKSE